MEEIEVDKLIASMTLQDQITEINRKYELLVNTVNLTVDTVNNIISTLQAPPPIPCKHYWRYEDDAGPEGAVLRTCTTCNHKEWI